jgi:(1->4)-alpha-D-glucan 1-alpha-D-glucosylmutase
VSLNEVGSDPQQFGLTPSLLHNQMKVRQQRWPGSLSATATHDTKRGEDVRARLNVLSEIPKRWKAHVTAWHKANRSCKAKVAGELLPGPNEEYLLYQTLIGAWPFEKTDEDGYAVFVERIQGYMNKAIKEAKEHTSWVSPDAEYEDAVRQFIARVLDRSKANAFWDDFLPFQDWVAQYGLYNSLSQLLIKMTAPGVPDFYQGTELWDLSLVDPDNRRPVDFSKRVSLLAELDKASLTESDRLALVQELVTNRTDGRIKLFLTAETLRYRRAHSSLFRHGEYVKLEAMGTKSAHLFAFARLHAEGAIVTVVPRLPTGITPDPHKPPLGDEMWNDTELVLPAWREGTMFRNIFTGEKLSTVTRGERQVLSLGRIFMHGPVACLEKTT